MIPGKGPFKVRYKAGVQPQQIIWSGNVRTELVVGRSALRATASPSAQVELI